MNLRPTAPNLRPTAPNLRPTAPPGRTILKMLLIGFALAGSVAQLHVGLADNGDYTRLMVWMTSGPSGFAENWPPDGTVENHERFFRNLPAFWKLDFPLTARWIGSILLLWFPGVLLNVLLYSPHTLYLPFISLVPRLVVLLFLWMLLRWIDREGDRAAPMLYIALGLPVVFIGFDTQYIAYFSSLFQEPASLTGLLLIILAAAWYDNRDDSRARPWLSAAAVLFMTPAKLSNIHWALLGGLLLVPWGPGTIGPRRRAMYILLIVVAPAGFSLLQASLYHTRTVNAYQSIYCGSLVFSERPQEHLDRLGMSDGAQYIGVHGFCDAGEEAMRRYRPKLTHRAVLDIILHEPSIAWDMLVFPADSMQRSELTHLSKRVLYNEPHTPRPWPAWLPAAAATASPLNAWSRLKRAIFPTGVPLVVILFLLALLPSFAWKHHRRLPRTLARTVSLLALAALVELWMQIFGDGQRDLIKHLYLANICFDGAVVGGVGLLVSVGVEKWKNGKME